MITRPTTTGTTISCLFAMVSSFYILWTDEEDIESWWSWFFIAALGAFIVGGLLVILARVTMVTLITVFVMLACAGNQRRALAGDGRKISSEVVKYLVKVVIKERGLVVVAGVTFVISMVMVWVS